MLDLTSRARELDHYLWKERRYVYEDKVFEEPLRLIVYADPDLHDLDEGLLEELESKGYTKGRFRADHREVLILGTWVPNSMRASDESEEVDPLLEMETLMSRYHADERRMIERAFAALASTRATNRISPKILVAELKYYAGYEKEVVVEAISRYLQRDCASENKKESYLRAIIRNLSNEASTTSVNEKALSQEAIDSEADDVRVRNVREKVIAEEKRKQDKMDAVVLGILKDRGYESLESAPLGEMNDIFAEAAERCRADEQG